MQASTGWAALAVALTSIIYWSERPAETTPQPRTCTAGPVALTFDDGPHPEVTPLVLDELDQADAKATFFVLGQQVDYWPETAREIRARGHRLGNHTFSHEHLTSLPDDEVLDELDRTTVELARQALPRPRLARPPYGDTDERVRDLIASRDMTQVLWDIDPRDYAGSTPDEIRQFVRSKLRPGVPSVVLLHDGEHTHLVEALPGLIADIRAAGHCLAWVEPAPGEELPGIGAVRLVFNEGPTDQAPVPPPPTATDTPPTGTVVPARAAVAGRPVTSMTTTTTPSRSTHPPSNTSPTASAPTTSAQRGPLWAQP